MPTAVEEFERAGPAVPESADGVPGRWRLADRELGERFVFPIDQVGGRALALWLEPGSSSAFPEVLEAARRSPSTEFPTARIPPAAIRESGGIEAPTFSTSAGRSAGPSEDPRAPAAPRRGSGRPASASVALAELIVRNGRGSVR